MRVIRNLASIFLLLRGVIGLLGDLDFVIKEYNKPELVAKAMNFFSGYAGGLFVDAVLLVMGAALLAYPWWPKSLHRLVARAPRNDPATVQDRNDVPTEDRSAHKIPLHNAANDIISDQEAVRRSPGNGWRVVRLIMKAATVDEVKALYKDFMSATRRTDEIDVMAAYALKRERLLDGSEEAREDWWWDFLEEMEDETTERRDEIASAISKLEKEFPGD